MAEAQTAFVKYVFLDVVGFTKERSVEAQAEVVAKLNQIVIDSLTSFKIDEDKRILIPTGDGMCIALVELTRPFDAHLLLGLEILSLIQKHNASTQDKMRQFEIRIGLNENVDNLITDVNGKLNVAGMGISTAQRIMSLADGGQILVSQTVFETLRGREKYMSAFREYASEVKHDDVLQMHQYIAEKLSGLNIEVPKTFRAEVKSEPKKLTKLVAYYIGHSLQNQDFFLSKKESFTYEYEGAILLYFRALDSVKKEETGKFDTYRPKTWKAGIATIEDQFNYYEKVDFHVRGTMREHIVLQILSEFSACFEDWKRVFVNSNGVKKLKQDWPEIAKEFGIE